MQAQVHGVLSGTHSDDILQDYIKWNERGKVIYFDGWNGFVAAPVLDSIAQKLRVVQAKKTPPELCFDKIIYVDCSAWKNTRDVQRKIAEGLELDPETMAIFDEQDEEDDFSGVDQGSRDVIISVAQVIYQTMVGRKSIIFFLNGSDSEIDVSRTGVPLEQYLNNMMIWTFKRRFLTMHSAQDDELAGKLRYTHLYLCFRRYKDRSEIRFNEWLFEEAASIIAHNPCLKDIGQTRVADCCLYEMFLHCSFHKATMFNWAAHSLNYWMCDGIVKGDTAREISNALHQEVRWVGYDSSLLEAMSEMLMKDEDNPFLVANDNTVESSIVVKEDRTKEISVVGRRPYRWISITSKNLRIQEGMLQTVLESASSLFIAFETSNNPQGLPNVLFKQSSNLSVLILSWCAFSFVSPPFLHCHGLRFLGLDNCKNDNTSEGDNCSKWVFLHGLWVLDIRYTDWDEILTEGKMDIMVNLRELNIEGLYCWQYASKLQGRLPNLERLRIIKPTHQAETSIDSNNSFIGKTKLQVLDLSGNKDMKTVPAGLWVASGLQVLILDGCDGIENVDIPKGIHSSLRSFSFDGYGPATCWTSSFNIPPESSRPKHRSDADNKGNAITSKISLQGCTMLENLFVRGLPNLEELDLSGSAIKMLNFETAVVDVPGLKRLILLGCKHLRNIRWGPWKDISHDPFLSMGGPFHYKGLDLLCIDTQSATSALGFTLPSIADHKSPRLHAILADPRLATRCLLSPKQYVKHGDACFNIHITCSTEPYGDEAAGQKLSKHPPCGDQQHHVLEPRPYGDDVLVGIGDAPMTDFPQPPAQQSDGHIEISGGSRSLESELSRELLSRQIATCGRSVHVHDVSTSASFRASFGARVWGSRWCRVERCPNWNTVFSPGIIFGRLETIWASELKKARYIQSGGPLGCQPAPFWYLRHLHLHSCPMLQFALPLSASPGDLFPHLTTLHIIRCDRLRHVFALEESVVERLHRFPYYYRELYMFPELATVHLYELPSLQLICERKMSAPALQTVRVRGCFALRRLPDVAARKPGSRRPAVEMEKGRVGRAGVGRPGG